MSEPDVTPSLLFLTRTNTELGAESIAIDADGSVVLRGILKKVTEGMLTSYPLTMLGKWTPNRAALRYPGDEIAERKIRRFGDTKPLDLAAIRSVAS